MCKCNIHFKSSNNNGVTNLLFHNLVISCHLELQVLVLHKLFNLYIAITVCTQVLCITFCGYRHNNNDIQMYAFTPSFTYSQSIHVPYITFIKARMPFLCVQQRNVIHTFCCLCVCGISLFSQHSLFFSFVLIVVLPFKQYSFSRHIQSSTSYFM